MKSKRPNVLIVFGDQWRAHATGYGGDPNVRTPNLDRLAEESVNFTNAVAGCPVCSPYRASLITGRHPLTHGVFMNDVCLNNEAVSMAQAFAAADYDTAYIGKWHLDGHGRTSFIPRERRQGFDFWKALECTHKYNDSEYFGDENVRLKWNGYDAFAQTREAERYIREHDTSKPFLMVLSWGPPHAPYQTAPQQYRDLYEPDKLELRPNVPEEVEAEARTDLAGYYAHITALDNCVGQLISTLDAGELAEDTIVLFTSDHGDMLGSHGHRKKQRPWDESIRVPFLLRYPGRLGRDAKTFDSPIDAPDVMPTLLGLCDVGIPETAEGLDYSGMMLGGEDPSDKAAVIACYQPFGQYRRDVHGGREYRGLRTPRYTYVRDLEGPWLLYDNDEDPYQLLNLVGNSEHAPLQVELDGILNRKLEERGDEFLPGPEYLERWGYVVDETGTVPYTA